MKDNEIRGLLLQRYYDRRRDGMVQLEDADFGGRLSDEDIAHVSVQLLEHGLVNGQKLEGMSEGLIAVMARITAHGVDVVEGTAKSPIAIHLIQDRSIKISDSHGVVIGDSNTQTVNLQIGKIFEAIDRSSVSESEKIQAKSKFVELLKLPVFSTLAASALALWQNSAS